MYMRDQAVWSCWTWPFYECTSCSCCMRDRPIWICWTWLLMSALCSTFKLTSHPAWIALKYCLCLLLPLGLFCVVLSCNPVGILHQYLLISTPTQVNLRLTQTWDQKRLIFVLEADLPANFLPTRSALTDPTVNHILEQGGYNKMPFT